MLEGIHHKHCALNIDPASYDVVGEHIIGTIVEMLNPPKVSFCERDPQGLLILSSDTVLEKDWNEKRRNEFICTQAVLTAWGELYGAVAAECIGRSNALYGEMSAKKGGWLGVRVEEGNAGWLMSP
jgi:hypothetical protein